MSALLLASSIGRARRPMEEAGTPRERRPDRWGRNGLEQRALYQRTWAPDDERQPLFSANREHVLDEVVAILVGNADFGVHPIEDLTRQLERPGQKIARAD